MNFDELEEFNDNNVGFVLSSKILQNILQDLKNEICINFQILEKNNEIDMQYHKKKINLNVLDSIIDSYYDEDYSNNNDERKIYIYNGDPYLTLELILASLLNGIKSILIVDKQFMIGVNEILVKIINNVLLSYNIKKLFMISYNFDEKIINKFEYDELNIIGDTFNYDKLKNKYNNVKFIPYNNIGLYCENAELESLKAAIYVYTRENFYEYEDIDAESPVEALECIKYDDTKDVIVLFTNNDNTKRLFVENIKDRDLIINENPFKNEYKRIEKYIR